MSAIQGVISDFGGVLTSPLADAFVAYSAETGIPLEHLGGAMSAMAERTGKHPLFELETGRVTEVKFIADLGREISVRIGREVSLEGFGATYMAHLTPNERLIEYLRTVRRRGLRMAICTNNVREWESLWRAKLPVDEIFDFVVDSGFVGHRKPDPEIYNITLERLGTPPEATLFLDDVEINCQAAAELGMRVVWFRDTDQAIAELQRELAA